MPLTVTQLPLPGLGAACEPGGCRPLHGKGTWRPCVRCGAPTWVFLGKKSVQLAGVAVGAVQGA
jgi:hypothetical protein